MIRPWCEVGFAPAREQVEIQVVGEAGDGREAVAVVTRTSLTSC